MKIMPRLRIFDTTAGIRIIGDWYRQFTTNNVGLRQLQSSTRGRSKRPLSATSLSGKINDARSIHNYKHISCLENRAPGFDHVEKSAFVAIISET